MELPYVGTPLCEALPFLIGKVPVVLASADLADHQFGFLVVLLRQRAEYSSSHSFLLKTGNTGTCLLKIKKAAIEAALGWGYESWFN
jgi:hypothetical protein